MSLTAGACLGPYEIVAPLGEGGMGEVYRARDTKLQREVAIKVLPERLASDPQALGGRAGGSRTRETRSWSCSTPCPGPRAHLGDDAAVKH